jgi:hypothetical protein
MSVTKTFFSDNASLPPFGTFDVGIRSAGTGNFVGGNPNLGLTAGQSATVKFTFSNQTASNLESSFQALFANSSATNPLVVGRFQQVGGYSPFVEGGSSDKVVGALNPPAQAVPEPATMLGLVTAGVVGSVLKRRQLQKQS